MKLHKDPTILTMKSFLLTLTEKDKAKLWSLFLCSSLLLAMEPFFCTTPVASTSLPALMRTLAYRVSKEAQKHIWGSGKQQREEPSH